VLRALADHINVRVVDERMSIVDHDGALRPWSPQRVPISAFGLMPAEITTMSQSSVVPLLNAEAAHLVGAEDVRGLLLQVDVTCPSASMLAFQKSGRPGCRAAISMNAPAR